MSEDNNHIERFFKQHLEVEQTSNMEEDWAKMELKLDATFGKPVPSKPEISIRKGIIILIITTTIAFLLGWFLRPLKTDKRNLVQGEMNSSFPQSENSSSPHKIDSLQKTDRNNRSSSEGVKSALKESSQASPTINIKRQSKEPKNAIQKATSDLISQNETENTEHITHETYYLNSLLLPLPKTDSLWAINSSPAFPDSTASTIDSSSRFNWKHVALGISWAPDFASVNFKGKQSPTNKFGIRIFWKPLKRLELQTGIFLNEKKYTSPGDEYHPPEGYWKAQTNGIIPASVNGSCTVIDIPITLGIDFIQTPKWNWSFNTGISNYVLLDEKYVYTFDQNNPDATDGWQTLDNSHLNWSIANASIGAEFTWRQKTSIKLEPFIQIPLQEVGWGKVSLYGYGALFTIKHQLIPKGK